MQDLTLEELSTPIRDFLTRVGRGDGVLIRDEAGRAVVSIVPHPDPLLRNRDEAREALRPIQKQIGDRLRLLGVSEEEFDRAILEGDVPV